MANPANVGSTSITGTSVTAVHVNYTCTTGNALVVSGAGPFNATLTISDQNNNTFNAVYAINSSTINATLNLWIATNITGSNEQFTLSSTISGAMELIISEYSGLQTNSVQDGNTSNTGTTTAMSSGSITTTNAEDLLISYLGPASSISAPGTGWTSRITTSFSNVLAEKVISAAGSNSNDATQSSTGTYIDTIAAFKSPGTASVVRPSPVGSFIATSGPTTPRAVQRMNSLVSASIVPSSATTGPELLGLKPIPAFFIAGASTNIELRLRQAVTPSAAGVTPSAAYTARLLGRVAQGQGGFVIPTAACTIRNATPNAPNIVPLFFASSGGGVY